MKVELVDVDLMGIKCLNENVKISDDNGHYLVYTPASKLNIYVQGRNCTLHKESVFFVENGQVVSIECNKGKYYLIKLKGEVVDSVFGLDKLCKKVYCLHLSNEMKNILNELIKYADCPKNLYSLGLIYQLLHFISIDLEFGFDEEKKSYHVELAKSYIQSNYFKDISITDIAQVCNLHPNYLANMFHKEMNITPKGYLIKIRMEMAKKLLLTNKYKIQTISKKVGYKHPLYFSQTFKKYYGVSPTSLINNIKI